MARFITLTANDRKPVHVQVAHIITIRPCNTGEKGADLLLSTGYGFLWVAESPADVLKLAAG